MADWIVNGTAYRIAGRPQTWQAGELTIKARRVWRERQHPRDWRGRFVRVGDTVQVSGGTSGTFQGVDSSGRIRVRDSSGTERAVPRSQATFGDQPAPAPAKPSKPASVPAPAIPNPLPPSPITAPPPVAAWTWDLDNTKTAKPDLPDSQRKSINDLNIDDPDSIFGDSAREGAAALRAKKPLTALQAEALATVVRLQEKLGGPGLTKAKRKSLLGGASRLDTVVAQLRGFNPSAIPASDAADPIALDLVKAGDVIALPGKGGKADVLTVAEAVPWYGMWKYTLTDSDGGSEVRFVAPGTPAYRYHTADQAAALKVQDAQAGPDAEPVALYDEPGAVEALAQALKKPAPDDPEPEKTTSGPGPGAVTPAEPWYDTLGLKAGGPDTEPVPVSGLTVEGYTVKTGIAWRQGGRSYLVELKPGETAAQAHARGQKFAVMAGQVLDSAPKEKAVLQRGLALLEGHNPSDSYWAAKYNMPGFHSEATGGFGTTTFWAGQEPKPTTIAHEFGHTIDSTAYGTDQWLSEADGPVVPGQHMAWKDAAQSDAIVSSFYKGGRFKETRLHPFVKPITVGEDGVTGYGSVDPREDFAESVRLWMKDRREGKVGYDPTTGDNLRYADLFPQRAKILDAVFGTTTDFDTPARKKRRKEVEDKFLDNLKKADAGDDVDQLLVPQVYQTSGLPFADVVDAQASAYERLAKEKADAKAKAAAEAAKAKAAADKLAAENAAAAEGATVTAALAAGKLAAADAKKFRLQVTLYKKKLRAQGFTEAEVAQMAAAHETMLMHQHFGLGDYGGLPKSTPDFSTKENKAAHELLEETAGKAVHPLSKQQHGKAEQAKANIAAEIASRLNNPEDWEKFRAWKKSSVQGYLAEDVGEFGSLTESERQAKLDAEVSSRVSKWAGTSGDSDDQAVLMQEAVKHEFGLDAPSAPTMNSTAFDSLIANQWDVAGPWFQRVARRMYENTQDEFKKAGITRISVYRGMSFLSYSSLGVPEWAKTPGQRAVALQPANSWSTRRTTSMKFVNSGHKIMLKASFPVEMVLGSALTGFGCLDEQEYVIFDGDGDINVEVLK